MVQTKESTLMNQINTIFGKLPLNVMVFPKDKGFVLNRIEELKLLLPQLKEIREVVEVNCFINIINEINHERIKEMFSMNDSDFITSILPIYRNWLMLQKIKF